MERLHRRNLTVSTLKIPLSRLSNSLDEAPDRLNASHLIADRMALGLIHSPIIQEKVLSSIWQIPTLQVLGLETRARAKGNSKFLFSFKPVATLRWEIWTTATQDTHDLRKETILMDIFEGFYCSATNLIMHIRIHNFEGAYRAKLAYEALERTTAWATRCTGYLYAIVECGAKATTKSISTAEDVADYITAEIKAMGITPTMGTQLQKLHVMWDFGYFSWGPRWQTRAAAMLGIDSHNVHVLVKTRLQKPVEASWFSGNTRILLPSNIRQEMDARSQFMNMSALWPYASLEEMNQNKFSDQ